MSEKTVEFENNDYDIEIKEEEYHPSNGLDSHYLTLKFEGKDNNVKIINMLRRVCANYIPMYAFPREAINIKKNTSIAFNNDMMKMDLSLLPIYGVDAKLDELEEEYYHDVNYADRERKKHDNEKHIEFYLSYKNDTNDYAQVTTNDAEIYVDGKKVDMYSKENPWLIIELKEGQSFTCHMTAALGIADRLDRNDDAAIWKGCKRAYHIPIKKIEKNMTDEEKKNAKITGYNLTVVGNEQVNEYDLLIRSCSFVIKKLNRLKKKIHDDSESGKIVPNQIIKFVFENEDHTICEPINYELQDHNDIQFSGFSKPDQLVKTGMIEAKTFDFKKNPIKPMIESIDILLEKIHKIGYILETISGKSKKTNKLNKKISRNKDENNDEIEMKNIKKKQKGTIFEPLL